MEPPSRPGPAAPDIPLGSSPEIIVDERLWRRLAPGAERIARRAAMAAGGADTVVLSDDRAVKRLNARHRGRNKPTNVLTFDAMGQEVGDPGAVPEAWGSGGEIILALGVVRREARAQGRSVADHLAHLVVHGALHLRGFDHGEAGDARRMEQEEARLLSRLGVANPWKPRTA